MKAIKIVAVLVLVYVGMVVAFESLLGYFQPENDGTLIISTQAADGAWSPRVLARIEVDGQLYVAANHWPRAWFREALANPVVKIESDEEQGSFRAVLLEGAEHNRVNAARPLGPAFRFLTGFPPRYLLRLEPVQP